MSIGAAIVMINDFCLQDGEVFEFFLNTVVTQTSSGSIVKIALHSDLGEIASADLTDYTNERTFKLLYKGKNTSGGELGYHLRVEGSAPVGDEAKSVEKQFSWGYKVYKTQYPLTA